MLFSVIYSLNVPHGISVKRYTPPQVGRLWTMTEGDEQFEYSRLGTRRQLQRRRRGRHPQRLRHADPGSREGFLQREGLAAGS